VNGVLGCVGAKFTLSVSALAVTNKISPPHTHLLMRIKQPHPRNIIFIRICR